MEKRAEKRGDGAMAEMRMVRMAIERGTATIQALGKKQSSGRPSFLVRDRCESTPQGRRLEDVSPSLIDQRSSWCRMK